MTEGPVRIYTDGGCSPNPGPGGWAALFLFRDVVRFISGYSPDTTNNRMELTAAINALKNLKWSAVIELRTDSRYLRDGMQRWLENWQLRNWRTSDNKPVLNQDLWVELSTQISTHKVHWIWVRAHSEDKYNNFVDWLVGDAINNRVGRDSRMTIGDLERMVISSKRRR